MKKGQVIIVSFICAVVVAMVLFSLIALYIFCKQRNKKKIYEIIPEMKQNKKSLLFSLQTVLDDPSIPHIAYSDLVFGDRLGTGASCDVFYATFRNHPVFPFPFLLFFFLFSFLPLFLSLF